MKFSEKIPDKPGFYFWRRKGAKKKNTYVQHVLESETGELYTMNWVPYQTEKGKIPTLIDRWKNTEWAGPIPEPE